jgi:hypothetical protein
MIVQVIDTIPVMKLGNGETHYNVKHVHSINVITQRELAQDNVQCFGMAQAASILANKKVPFAIAYWMLMGKAPRSRV